MSELEPMIADLALILICAGVMMYLAKPLIDGWLPKADQPE